ncbi:MAG: hypothetical protein P8078_10580, partial [bacterium]
MGEHWKIFTQEDGLGKGGISALAYRKGKLWAATSYSVYDYKGEIKPAGSGIGYTEDGGDSWQWFAQPVDPEDITEYSPTTSVRQNIIYDIALTDSTVWIASF